MVDLEQLSDSEIEILEHIADVHDAAREGDLSDMALEYEPLPDPPRTPWATLGEALLHSERTTLAMASRYELRVGSDAVTVRPIARAS